MATRVTDRILEQAAERIDALATRAKEALYNAADGARTAQGAVEGARGRAWRLIGRDWAGRSGGRSGSHGDDIYARGRRTALALGRRIEERPWRALAIAGVVGLVLGYRLRHR